MEYLVLYNQMNHKYEERSMIDIHTHIGRFGRKDSPRVWKVHELVRKMDKSGIEKSMVLPLHDSPHGYYIDSTTEDVLRETAKFPDRLIPFCQIDPRFGLNSVETDFLPLLSEYRDRGCRGAGEITANMYFDDPRVIRLMQQCGEAGLPVTFHAASCLGGCYGLVDDAGLPRLETLLKSANETIFVGHAFAFWSEISSRVEEETRGALPDFPVEQSGRTVALLRKYPNLYGDLAGSCGFNALTRSPDFGFEFLEEFQDKLLFGTDTMIYDMTDEITPIIPYMKESFSTGKISKEAYEKITHLNAVRLFHL